MYNRILVAVDPSELSKQALTQAIAVAKAFQAKLHLVHILSPLQEEYQDLSSVALGTGYYPGIVDDSRQTQWQTLEEQGLELLRSLAETATSAGVSTEFIQMIGQPETKICEFAQTWGADLIVIGSHRRTGLSELFLGSVSNYVSHHVPCSVLIVHQPDKEE